MYVCMYMCVCVCMCICVYVFVYVCVVFMWVYVCGVYVCGVYVWCVCVCVCVWMNGETGLCKCKEKCDPCANQVLPRTQEHANVTFELKNEKQIRPNGTNQGSGPGGFNSVCN